MAMTHSTAAGHDDVLGGGEGRDRLFGDKGSDTLSGGAGRDRFIYDIVDFGGDRITDFTQGADKIVFKGETLDADGDLTFIGTAEFSGGGQGELRFQTGDNYTLVDADNDGDGSPDTRILLTGAMNITAADFVIG